MRRPILVWLAGLLAFLLFVQIPTHLGYYTYSSDARGMFENPGFQLLDALHGGELPWWDAYSSNGRDGGLLAVGFGSFAPDLLLFSWAADRLLPDGARVVDKSFVVILLLRHFILFGGGAWCLGSVFLRTLRARAFFWIVLVFGTPAILPLNNALLGHYWGIGLWALFFTLRFAVSGQPRWLLGLMGTAATAFLTLARDFPFLLCFTAICLIAAAAVYRRPLLDALRSMGLAQRALVAVGLSLLAGIALQAHGLGEAFLGSFMKRRYLQNGVFEVPLTAPIPDDGMLFGRLLPDLRSLALPLPSLTPAFGNYHPAHSYLFPGASGIVLLAFSAFAWRERRVRFFALLALLLGSTAYWASSPLHWALWRLVPGVSQYQYPFHLKYLFLTSLVALASIGLDVFPEGCRPDRARRLIGWITAALTAVQAWLLLAFQGQARAPLRIFAGGAALLVAARICQAFLLARAADGKKPIPAFRLVSIEAGIALVLLALGHPVHRAGFAPICHEPMYHLGHRVHGFTLRRADAHLDDFNLAALHLGDVYKVNLRQEDFLRYREVADLSRELSREQGEALFGAGSPRLFLAEGLRPVPPGSLPEEIRRTPPSRIRAWVPVPDGTSGPGPAPPSSGSGPPAGHSLSRIEIRAGSIRAEPVSGRDGWSVLTVADRRFSRHLSSNPFIVRSERISVLLNGKEIPGSWLRESLESEPEPCFELSKRHAGELRVLAPPGSTDDPVIEIRHLDAGGIRVEGCGYAFVDLVCEADRERPLVFLDAYDEGWSAQVDGAEAPIRKAYGAYKAVVVPAGEHRVRFSFRSRTGRLWARAYLCYFLLAAVAMAGALASGRGSSPPGERGA